MKGGEETRGEEKGRQRAGAEGREAEKGKGERPGMFQFHQNFSSWFLLCCPEIWSFGFEFVEIFIYWSIKSVIIMYMESILSQK